MYLESQWIMMCQYDALFELRNYGIFIAIIEIVVTPYAERCFLCSIL